MPLTYKPKKLKNWTIKGHIGYYVPPPTAKSRWRIKLYEAVCNNCGQTQTFQIYNLKRDHVCEKCRNKPKGHSGLMYVYRFYKRSAKDKSLAFSLSVEQFRIITSSRCHYCGQQPDRSTLHKRNNTEWGAYTYNGIDRKHNQEGYTVHNSLPCCTICNWAKSSRPYSQFIEYLKRVAQYINNHNGERC